RLDAVQLPMARDGREQRRPARLGLPVTAQPVVGGARIPRLVRVADLEIAPAAVARVEPLCLVLVQARLPEQQAAAAAFADAAEAGRALEDIGRQEGGDQGRSMPQLD